MRITGWGGGGGREEGPSGSGGRAAPPIGGLPPCADFASDHVRRAGCRVDIPSPGAGGDSVRGPRPSVPPAFGPPFPTPPRSEAEKGGGGGEKGKRGRQRTAGGAGP